jgi:ribosomal protein S18 acetylase RimI-like enzyme
VRLHYAFDPRRFLLVDRVEDGYEHWFRRELKNASASILAAESSGEIIGYSYARLEERDWNQLLDEHAALHDVYVHEKARGSGVGLALVRATFEALREKGARLLVLHTAVQNESAQRLFRKAGFRESMLEMSCDLG